MSQADQHADPRQCRDSIGRRQLGRERHHHLAAPRLEQQRHQRIVQRTEMPRIVDPLARDVDHRALDMRTEHARYARRDRRVGRVERLRDRFVGIADQRRQERGGAERAMRIADRGNALDTQRVVEEDAAAAIDLCIDETGHQPTAVEIDRSWTGAVDDRDDDTALDVDHRVAEHPTRRDDMTVDERMRSHSVMVTLLRWLGASGS